MKHRHHSKKSAEKPSQDKNRFIMQDQLDPKIKIEEIKTATEKSIEKENDKLAMSSPGEKVAEKSEKSVQSVADKLVMPTHPIIESKTERPVMATYRFVKKKTAFEKLKDKFQQVIDSFRS